MTATPSNRNQNVVVRTLLSIYYYYYYYYYYYIYVIDVAFSTSDVHYEVMGFADASEWTGVAVHRSP